jgi:hypothetical protein
MTISSKSNISLALLGFFSIFVADQVPFVAAKNVRTLTGKKNTKSSKKTKACKSKKQKAELPETCVGVDTDLKPDFPEFMDPRLLQFQQDAGRCLLALENSGFDFGDPNIGKWLGDDSILNLPETGYYVGAENIVEYVGFLASPYFGRLPYGSGHGGTQGIPISADGNECTFLFVSITTFHMNPVYTGKDALSYDTTVGVRLKFTVTDASPEPQTIKMNRMEVYYPRNFLEAIFEDLYTDKVAGFICENMKNKCDSVFTTDNSYTSIDQCVEEILCLVPAAGNGANLDGKSMGCRAIHGAFAADNNNHCPHISFVPKYDEGCFLKCQESKGVSAQDFFLPQELEFFAKYSSEYGLGGEQWGSPTKFPVPQ